MLTTPDSLPLHETPVMFGTRQLPVAEPQPLVPEESPHDECGCAFSLPPGWTTDVPPAEPAPSAPAPCPPICPDPVAVPTGQHCPESESHPELSLPAAESPNSARRLGGLETNDEDIAPPTLSGATRGPAPVHRATQRFDPLRLPAVPLSCLQSARFLVGAVTPVALALLAPLATRGWRTLRSLSRPVGGPPW